MLVKLGDFGTALFDFAQFSVSVMPAATNTDNSIMCAAAYTTPELLERGTKPQPHPQGLLRKEAKGSEGPGKGWSRDA